MYKNNIHPGNISTMLDDLFQQGVSRTSEVINKLGHAPVNIFETPNGYQLSLVAPGLSKEAFKINLEDKVLKISFEAVESETETPGTWLRREFKTRSFNRSFNMNEKIDAAGITAKYTDGILLLELPKKAVEAPLAQNIPVL